jgi:hypothetical protein
MIAIINTYGYPSPSRFHFSGTAGVILVHAQPRYADTLQKLLDVERTEKRITNNEYAYIIWHLNGRVGIPQFDSNSGIKIKNKRRYKSANIIAEPVTLDSIGH